MDPAVDLTLRAALVALFGIAAAHKLRDVRGFRATLAEYRLVPDALVPLAVIAVIGAELAGVAGLVLHRSALLVAAGVLVLYAGAIGINLARGRRHIDCGCAGPGARRPLSAWLVARNVALAVAALSGTIAVRPRPLIWVDAVTVVGATAVLAAVYAAVDRMLADAPALARLRGEA